MANGAAVAQEAAIAAAAAAGETVRSQGRPIRPLRPGVIVLNHTEENLTTAKVRLCDNLRNHRTAVGVKILQTISREFYQKYW